MVKITPSSLKILLLALATMCLNACVHKDKDEDEKSPKHAKTPVTVASLSEESIAETITLNASSSFLKKNTLKATTGGYIKSTDAAIGKAVKAGTVLYTIQTKEAAAYKNMNLKDTSMLVSGLLKIKATCDGIISSIAHYTGEYVQDGDQLCTISDQSSLIFLLQVPFEMNKFIHLNDACMILLPDSSMLNARMDSRINEMDATSQMISYMVKPLGQSNVPENLLANISITKSKKDHAAVIPKAAILTNETQTDYWVMKMVNDTTAVKIPVTIGLHDRQNIEILTPKFSPTDRLLTSGNYGLADTATVSISK